MGWLRFLGVGWTAADNKYDRLELWTICYAMLQQTMLGLRENREGNASHWRI